MITPQNLAQQLDLVVGLWAEAGVVHWVVSPGSRNAPIVAALLRNPVMELHASPDERSAAFVALGIAQTLRYPAAFLCTSGTALVNAFPAVCEAYYQRIPLMIVSADRPEHLIDQWDGQTLRQKGIFGSYSRFDVHLNPRLVPPGEYSKFIYPAVECSIAPIPGPTHTNIALDEPIYEGIEEQNTSNIEQYHKKDFTGLIPSFVFKAFDNSNPASILKLNEALNSFPSLKEQPKIAIVVGLNPPDQALNDTLQQIQYKLPIFADTCSHQTNIGIENWDWGLLKREIPDSLKPDLIITLGSTLLSKPLKLKLQQWKSAHIHVGLYNEVGDPFQTKPLHWVGHEADFIETLRIAICSNENWEKLSETWLQDWQNFIDGQTLNPKELGDPFENELNWVRHFVGQLQSTDILQVGNSMSIRYVSWSQTQARIYANRGVSGIDGCLSTAVGCALANRDSRVYVVLGDVSAVYDSNALWMNFPSNLSVIILNNSGGRIFDWIQGPNQFSKLRPFVHNPKTFDFKSLSEFYQLPYTSLSISNTDEIQQVLNKFTGGIIDVK